jgi:hypothetical protein
MALPEGQGTMADVVIKTSYKLPNYVQSPARLAIATARKFVLGPDMSEFLVELARAPMKDIDRAPAMMDEMRKLSRLPHAKTWIEYDPRAYQSYLHEHYPGANVLTPGQTHAEADMFNILPSIGWLLEQHESVETAFRMTPFCAMTLEPPEVTLLGATSRPKDEDFYAATFAWSYAWTTDDTPLPWKQFITSDTTEDAATVATGVMKYNSPFIGLVRNPYAPTRLATRRDHIIESLTEFVGELRRCFAILATINKLPVSHREVRPSKGYMAKGNYKKFVEHRVITLNVPQRVRYAALARHTFIPIRRKAHMVRGHWREDWRNPLSKTCDHQMESIGLLPNKETHNTLQCTVCKGRKIWVHEHERGDAGLGFVTHDYHIKKGDA